jgi:hypothetical protein
MLNILLCNNNAFNRAVVALRGLIGFKANKAQLGNKVASKKSYEVGQ